MTFAVIKLRGKMEAGSSIFLGTTILKAMRCIEQFKTIRVLYQ